MKCPRDQQPLKTLNLKTITVDVCTECHGVWFDGGEFKRLVELFMLGRYDQDFSRWQKLAKNEIAPSAEFWREDNIYCDRDGALLRKHFFAGDSGIGIDNCPSCDGFWLDGEEVDRLWRYVKPNPAMDRAVQELINDQKKWLALPKIIERASLNLAQMMGVIIANPLYLLYFIGKPLAEIIIADAKSN